MYCDLPAAGATTPTREHIRELAERTSNGTLRRLFWLQGTRELWVEICEPEFDITIVIPAEPERALEAFTTHARTRPRTVAFVRPPSCSRVPDQPGRPRRSNRTARRRSRRTPPAN
jgi:hypothetical protein